MKMESDPCVVTHFIIHILQMEANAFVQAVVIDRGLPTALDTEVLAVEESSLRYPALNTYLKEI